MKVLILGASGMIGSAMLRVFSEMQEWTVIGTVRAEGDKARFSEFIAARMLAGVDVSAADVLLRLFAETKPEVVVNCVGLTKHQSAGNQPLNALLMNTLLPHRLVELCGIAGARLIHVSTDCVFSGNKGKYHEEDMPDASDLYGKSKHLGEVDAPHAVTLRTSTIGHELQSSYGLLEWFLAQQGNCRGFSRAVFSGLPNTEFARVVRDFVVPRPELHGLYHVGGEAINKYDLLCKIAATYDKKIEIRRDDSFVIDRSLDSGRFRQVTGYVAASWPELIRSMHATRI